jgi:hypothetical protein
LVWLVSAGPKQRIPACPRGGIAISNLAVSTTLAASLLGASAVHAQSLAVTSADIKEGGTIADEQLGAPAPTFLRP